MMNNRPLMDLRRDLSPADGEMLLVHKPAGWTSFDVVKKMRRLLHVRKIGHAGTLDPLATGLLIVCTGKMTKVIDTYQGQEKEYQARIRLGERTESYDAETAVIETRPTDHITPDMVRAALAAFEGSQTQLPPMWSAAKVAGKRLYKYAQRGETVERRSREIFIKSIVPGMIAIPDVEFTVVCSKGTYIRTLAEELGRALGCGAYLTRLVRTRIGEYRLEDALTIEDLTSRVTATGTPPA